MAILKIARMGHPVLKTPARPVDDPTHPAITRLVRDMADTMIDAPGTGLAAPQVYVPLRVVIFFVSRQRARAEAEAAGDIAADDVGEDAGSEGLAVPLTVLINPEIEVLDETTTLGVEGCLSVPGMMGQVPRFNSIRYRGLTPEGQVIEREASGFHARVVQHECDHLDGILYPQRMVDMTSFMFTTEVGKEFDEADGLRDFLPRETSHGS